MYEFEKHEKLTEFIREMAHTGKAPREWTTFIETLNQALRIHDIVGLSEQLPPEKITDKEHKDSEMLFHECPECNWRCNCSDQPCSCCRVLI
jgi:hypothetical protein